MEEHIIDGIKYIVKRQNVKEGDYILDKNSATVYKASWSDYDELGWVVISKKG